MCNRTLRSFLLILLLGCFAAAQDSLDHPVPAAAKQQFFAGIVTDLDANRITISRSVLGRPAEHRTFLITQETKLGKNLHTRVRVTVRYVNRPEGDVALEVLVRSQPKGSRGT
jgi:hypothetical protein